MRLRGLVEMQEEIQREYGRLVAVTVDEPYVNGALRAGIGASFPFLSDEDRAVAAGARRARAHGRDAPAPPADDLRPRLAAPRPRGVVRLLVLGQPDAGRAPRGLTRDHQRGAAELRATGALVDVRRGSTDAGIDAEGGLDPRVERGARALARRVRRADPRRGATISGCRRSTGDRGSCTESNGGTKGSPSTFARPAPHSPRLVKHHMTVPPSVRYRPSADWQIVADSCS